MTPPKEPASLRKGRVRLSATLVTKVKPSAKIYDRRKGAVR